MVELALDLAQESYSYLMLFFHRLKLLSFGGALFFSLIVSISIIIISSGCASIITIERIEPKSPLPTPTLSPVAVGADPILNRTPVRIVADAIDLDAPVVEMGWATEERQGQVVSEWIIPVDDAGWHRNSAWPGQEDNVVISGHNASLGGHVFAQVENLAVGDLITVVTASEESFYYQVQEKSIVRTLLGSQEGLDFLREAIGPTPNERLTLLTCWPSWSNTHRLVVVAEPYSDE